MSYKLLLLKQTLPYTHPTDIPRAESAALWDLYTSTAGSSWTDNTNWFSTTTANDWYGVTVVGGKVTVLDLDANNLVGDIGAWSVSAFTGLTTLYLNSNTLEGDLSGWTLPSSLVTLFIYSNSFTGDLSGWTLPSSLVSLRLYSNSFTGDLSGWTLPSSLVYLLIYSNSFTGDLSGWTLPSSLVSLFIYSNSFTGDLSGWALPSSLVNLRLYSNSFTWTTATGMDGAALGDFQIQDNGLASGHVDNIVEAMYNYRSSYTDATPTANVAGTNAAPGGIYQDGDPPTTGKEYIYELVNDPELEGFNQWVITYNA